MVEIHHPEIKGFKSRTLYLDRGVLRSGEARAEFVEALIPDAQKLEKPWISLEILSFAIFDGISHPAK